MASNYLQYKYYSSNDIYFGIWKVEFGWDKMIGVGVALEVFICTVFIIATLTTKTQGKNEKFINKLFDNPH